MKLLRFAIIFNLCLVIIGIAHISHAFELMVSASDTNPAKGSQVNFTTVPSGGTPPYKYCWDFGTPPNNAKLGEWSHENLAICYSTLQNPSHEYKHYGDWEAWVYVTDSSPTPVTEKAVLLISADKPNSGSSITLNPTSDCGNSNISTSGDNDAKLAACVNSQSASFVKVQIPTGTYTFGNTNSFSKDVLIEPSEGANVIFEFDADNPSDCKLDYLFSASNSAQVWVNGLTIEAFIGTGTPADRDITHFWVGGSDSEYHIVQNLTIKNFSYIDKYYGAYIKCSVIDWGMSNNELLCGGQMRHQAFFTQQNNFHKWIYSKSQYNHEHEYYMPRGRYYHYIIGNYLDSSNRLKSHSTFHQYGGTEGEFSYRFFYRNYAYKSRGSAFYMLTGALYSYQEIYDNIVDTVTSNSSMIGMNTANNISIKWNYFQNMPDTLAAPVGVGRTPDSQVSNITFQHNVFGINAGNSDGFGGKCFSIPSESCTPYPAYTIKTEPNFEADCGTFTYNIDDSSEIKVTDPHLWEFTSPINCSIKLIKESSNSFDFDVNADDYGSGLAGAPRWPFTEGGLLQFSSDGIHWSEVMPYNTQTTWKLPTGANKENILVRFRDRDGNWSIPVGLSIAALSPSPPKNLKIIY